MFGSRPLRWLTVMIVGFGILAGVHYAIDYLSNPWAYSSSSGAPLIGYWQGEIEFGPGDRRQVVLHLTHIPYSQDVPSGIAGAAKVCGPAGDVRYAVSGSTRNRAGTLFHIGFGGDSLGEGRHLDASDATWDGVDRIELRTTMNAVGADGGSRATASVEARTNVPRVDRVRFELRRASQEVFDNAC